MVWRPGFLLILLLLFHGESGAEQGSSQYEVDVGGTDGGELTRIFRNKDQADRSDEASNPNENDGTAIEVQNAAPATGLDEKLDDSTGESERLIVPWAVTENEEDQTAKELAKDEDASKNELSKPKFEDGDSEGHDLKTSRNENRDLQNHLKIDLQRQDGELDGDWEERRLSQRSAKNVAGNSSTPPPYIMKMRNTPARAELDDIYFLFIVIGCSVAGIAGLALAGYCWYKLHTTAKAVSEAEYSGYGARQPSQGAKGDQKLDYSAEMYHYHQTKSQLAAMEKASGARKMKGGNLEDEESGDEGDEGDYTVYECPGLAPTGDMTVVNPLFSDQEAVGSDQDANGHSGKSSPVATRDTSRES